MLEITKIKTHQGSQAREQINQKTVDDYCEDIISGAKFPAVVVFFDSTDYWLADGWHRLLAHQKAGKTSIQEDVKLGTQRDAILYSLGANDDHGLRRSNLDKRKAILTMLQDAEWGKWSNEHVAKICKVSPHTVADVRNSISANAEMHPKNPKETKTASRGGKVFQVDTANIGKKKTPSKPEPKQEVPAPSAEETPPEYAGDFTPSEDEINAALAAEAEQLEYIKNLLCSDDPLAQALKDVLRFKAAARVAEERFNGITNERNELIKMVKSLQRKISKLEKDLDKAKEF